MMVIFRYLLFGAFYPFLTGSALGAELTGTSVHFHGTVVSQPCSVAPGSEKILVDFKHVSVKDLYLNKKSTPVPFSIRLINCTTAVYNSVTVTFSGEENSELSNHLTIHPVLGGGAAGVAIGLKLQNGQSVELNKATSLTRLSTGNMNLGFTAYLEGEPDALQKREIQFGPFTASARYTVNYQ
ncbi:fimbrial protein [Erwinia rhapontici]|uniref:fimbrial protein n=1 Tax=Erwinia rhapontici TaxID=55212 RepID=UPI003B9E166F